MPQPLVIGNWKMHGSRASVKSLLDGIQSNISQVKNAQVAVCAPHIFIADVQAELQNSPIAWGAQDVSAHSAGAYTGEIAASMLVEYGCQFVIVGHSERRSYHAEGDQDVAEKFAAAHQVGLTPVLCIGENLEQRQAGNTEQVVMRQLDAVIDHCGWQAFQRSVIAYEPVWAIGTGNTATPEQAQSVHALIRTRIAQHDITTAKALRILYGGSMSPENASSLLAQEDIDGGLIGGASLDADKFIAICVAADSPSDKN